MLCCLLDTLIAPPLIDSILAIREEEQIGESERVNAGQEVENRTDERESIVCINAGEQERASAQQNGTDERESTVCMNDIGQEVTIETQRADEREETVCNEFFSNGCGCRNKCSMTFSESYLWHVRSQMAELSKDELDLVIIGEIASTIHDEDTIVAQKHASKQRCRPSTQYLHRGHRVLYLNNSVRTNLKCNSRYV